MLPGWACVEIAGKPADALDPPGALPFALVWLHDEDGRTPATDPAITADLRARRLRCVAPHAGRAWWVDRVCAEFDPRLTAERHLLDDVLPWVTATWKVEAPAVVGVGMGGQGAVRLGFRHPTRVRVVASVAGAFDFHDRYGRGTPLDAMYATREQARQDTAILHLDGHDWPRHVWFACPPGSEWHRGNDRLHEKLAAGGAPHAADLDTPADPHQLVGPMLAFVAAALATESRRLM